MTVSASPSVQRRPGGRSARIRAAVVAATIDALSVTGYDDLTMDDIATRAGVHKTTLYRRWPTKAELVAEAVRERSLVHVPVPDTGSLAGDLAALAEEVATAIGPEPGRRLTKTLVAASNTSPAVAEAAIGFWSERLRLTSVIVERAVARGEASPDTDPELVIEALIGPLYVRLLLTDTPIDDAYARRAAALVTAGVRGAEGSTS